MALNVGGPLTSPRKLGDLVIWEAYQDYCRESGTIENSSAVAATLEATDPVGYPLKSDGSGGYAFAEAGDEANVIGLLLAQETIPVVASGGAARTGNPYAILARGPAIVNEDQIVVADIIDGSAMTLATIKTALAALDIVCRAEPTKSSTQTT
jgi:hypothetical protein